MVGHLIYSVVVAVIVYLVGCIFDKTSNKRYATVIGLLTFVLVFFGSVLAG